jgi:hypothetical protein
MLSLVVSILACVLLAFCDKYCILCHGYSFRVWLEHKYLVTHGQTEAPLVLLSPSNMAGARRLAHAAIAISSELGRRSGHVHYDCEPALLVNF